MFLARVLGVRSSKSVSRGYLFRVLTFDYRVGAKTSWNVTESFNLLHSPHPYYTWRDENCKMFNFICYLDALNNSYSLV